MTGDKNTRERPNPTVNPGPHSIPVISLFCGCGGMDLGFRQSGFQTLLAVDHDRVALESFRRNHRKVPVLEADISTLSFETIKARLDEVAPGIRPRGVIGGPPCQPFSRGNVHKKKRDSRDRLPFHYAEILAQLNSHFHLDFFVFENVAGLAAKPHKRKFKAILEDLEGAGFTVYTGLIDAVHFGVPQTRRRLFVVGVNRELYPQVRYLFPEEQNDRGQVTVRDAIYSLPAPVFYGQDLKPARIPFHPNHWTMRPMSKKFAYSERSWRSRSKDSRSFRRLPWDKPSATVAYGHREIHVHPTGRRRLSVFEALVLQGFPRRYVLCGTLTQQVQQVSDAVPPPMARAIAERLKSGLYTELHEVHRKSLKWFHANGRQFPWRRTRNPYFVLLAEKLLQQTAAGTHVVASYKALTHRYPTIRSLARSQSPRLKSILKPLGLGYRAEELVRLSRAIVADHGSTIPKNYRQLVDLPGVGEYIARAVMSFAFQLDTPVVDTNIARLLHRYFGLQFPVSKNPARSRRLTTLAGNLVPPHRSREFNLALLDICAAYCLPSKPRCSGCPLSSSCHYASSQSHLSQMKRSTERTASNRGGRAHAS